MMRFYDFFGANWALKDDIACVVKINVDMAKAILSKSLYCPMHVLKELHGFPRMAKRHWRDHWRDFRTWVRR